MNNPSQFPRKKNSFHNSSSHADSSKSIIWKESDDVYKPSDKNISSFLKERDIQEIELDINPLKIKAESLNYLNQFLSEQSLRKLEISHVYIEAQALDNLRQHLESNLRVEQGGILFGNTYQDSHFGTYVEITASIPAPATIGTGAHLEFTSDSWLAIMDEAKTHYPDANIVGWYHSHPNIGVFMSGTDMRTQQAFFYHDWSVSIVYDPVRQDIGFFLGKNANKVNPIIINSPTAPKPINPRNTRKELPPARPTRRKKTKTKPKNQFYLRLLGSLLILFLLTLLSLNLFSGEETVSDSPSQEVIETPSWEITLEKIPSQDLRAIQDYAINYPTLVLNRFEQVDSKIGGGEELFLLSIAQPDADFTPNEVEVEFDKLVLQPQLNEESSLNSDIEKESVPLDSNEANISYVLFSNYNPPAIYLPRQLTYRDADNQEQVVEINLPEEIRNSTIIYDNEQLQELTIGELLESN